MKKVLCMLFVPQEVVCITHSFIVICLAYGKDLSSLTYLGMVGIIDPPRQGVFDAIHVLRDSGVRVKMITGDAMDTAVAIAKQIGLDVTQRNVISGEQLESMDHYQLRNVIEEVICSIHISNMHRVAFCDYLL